jgi:hypothetical protein
MFFTGAVGALLMYSVLKSTHQRHTYHEQGRAEYDAAPQSSPKSVTRRQEILQEELETPLASEQTSPQNAVLVPQMVYVPREMVREVVVDCSCKCVCKAPEKLEIPRSFWSLDQGNFVRSAGDKEAETTREKRRSEIAKMTRYWNLDQGMHADEKDAV